MAQAFITNGQHVRIGHHLAGIAPRAVALLTDLLLISFYEYGCSKTFSAFDLYRFINDWLLVCVFVLPIVFYFPLCEVFNNGQTFGKRLLNIRVVRLDGKPLNLTNALVRFLLLWGDALLGLGVGAVLIALTPRSQRLGDMAAGTTVVSDKAFKWSRVNLHEYDYLLREYNPVFVRAAELTEKQAHIIEHALRSSGKERPERLKKLCAKVEPICGLRNRKDQEAETYLTIVLNDYRYYQLQTD